MLHDLLARDLASLIHPQHDPAVQQAGRVWVRGVVFVLAPPFVTKDNVLDRISDIVAAAVRSVVPA